MATVCNVVSDLANPGINSRTPAHEEFKLKVNFDQFSQTKLFIS